ncbi:hypothetical protein BDA99DRAFT_577169 [Phascolomyces articulosus]|uniref:F-box domain-containing protein n=1 Tax=Phascolomyces articulosus TaxID=60185 RepID=A0AAD5P781_9FUNG|nr:hypothetical protein BDA99DRAFT_577169 [Phascolomyces articulosus]
MPGKDGLPQCMTMDYSLHVAAMSQKRITPPATHEFDCVSRIIQEALENGHYHAVIEHTLPLVQDLQTRLVALFKARVIAWGKQGRSQEELKEAMAMISYAPYDATGYLVVGRRYSDQGFQTRAIQIFNQGLHHVPTIDPHYKTLQQAIQSSEARHRRRLDILAHFPYDIACHVIDNVPQQTLVQCARVSTAWRAFILDYPKPWRCVHIDLNFSQALFLSHFYTFLLPLVIHHMEHLSILSFTCVTRNSLKQLFDMVKSSNLQSLQLITDKSFKQENYSDICSALTSVAETLTSLDIHFEGRNSIPSFSRILTLCPNLKSIKYFAETTLPIISPMILNNTTQLTNLDLSTPSDILSLPGTLQPITNMDIQNLIQRCPHLQNISVINCCVEIYEAIRHYCPDIRTVRVNQQTSIWTTPSEEYVSSKNSKKQLNGLKILEASSCFPSATTIVPLIETHHLTVCKLSIESRLPLIRHMFNRIPRSESDWSALCTISTLIHLVDLRLVSVPPSLCQYLPALLKQTPNLETFYLEDTDTMIGDGALMMLANTMPKLSDIWFINCQLNTSELRHMITLFAENKSSTSSLANIKLLGCTGIEQDVKVICAKIQSLNSLSIHLDGMSQIAVKAFVQDIAQLPFLQHLSVHNTDMTVEGLQIISTSTSLSSVDLISIGGVTEDEVKRVFLFNEILVLFDPCI